MNYVLKKPLTPSRETCYNPNHRNGKSVTKKGKEAVMAFLRLYRQTDKLNPSDKILSEQGKGRPKGLLFCFLSFPKASIGNPVLNNKSEGVLCKE